MLQPQERGAVIAYVNDVIEDMPLRPQITAVIDSNSQPRSKRSQLDSVNDFDDDLAQDSHDINLYQSMQVSTALPVRWGGQVWIVIKLMKFWK